MFNVGYARLYDLFYENKPYQTECEFLIKVFGSNVKTLLDVSCGTGNHIKILNDMGIQTTGIDASNAMLDIATTKVNCPLHNMSMTNFHFKDKFDAIIAMFSSVDYLKDDLELDAFFGKVKEYLNKDGFFLFDFWNKNSVHKYLQPYKEQYYGKGLNSFIKRTSLSKFIDEDTVEVEFVVYNLYGDKEIDWNQKPIHEIHTLKVYDPEEMMINLKSNGFIVEMLPFMKRGEDITRKDWNIQVICRQ